MQEIIIMYYYTKSIAIISFCTKIFLCKIMNKFINIYEYMKYVCVFAIFFVNQLYTYILILILEFYKMYFIFNWENIVAELVTNI